MLLGGFFHIAIWMQLVALNGSLTINFLHFSDEDDDAGCCVQGPAVESEPQELRPWEGTSSNVSSTLLYTTASMKPLSVDLKI